MSDEQPAHLTVTFSPEERLLTSAQFQSLSAMPPEAEWFANIRNDNTLRAYKNDLKEFMAFTGIRESTDFRLVKRSHFIGWRRTLELRELEPATVRRKLSALASLFDYLCESNAIDFNPVDGVKRPNQGMNEGKSPALGDEQAKAMLDAPSPDTLKGVRDRAILSILLFHGLRRAELCALRIGDIESRRGVLHFKVQGKGEKIRFVPAHPHSMQRITEYLEKSERGDLSGEPLFVRVNGNRQVPKTSLTGHAIFKDVVQRYARELGFDPRSVCVHGLRATAATNALDHNAGIEKVQDWLGHASIQTTRLYDRRKTKPEDSPTFKVNY